MANPGPASAVQSNVSDLLGQRLTTAQFTYPSAALLADTATVYQYAGILYISNGTSLVPLNGQFTLTTASASSAATAAANTAIMQAALDRKGIVQFGGQGVAYFNPPLYYDDDTTIVETPGLTLKAADNTNRCLLLSKATLSYLAGGNNVTLTWTAGVSVNVNRTAHGQTVGKAVYIWGVTPWVYVGVFRVETVVDANNFTINLPYTPTGVPVGTAKMIQAQQRFVLRGGLWDYGSNAAGGIDAHAIGIYFSENCHIKRPTRVTNAAKYAVCSAGTLNCTFEYDVPYNQSDGCKIYGPARNTFLNGLTGTTYDDGASAHTAEYGAPYFQYQVNIPGGELYNVALRNINCTSAGGVSLATIYMADNIPVNRVEVENVSGYGSLLAVRIQGQSQANAKFGSIVLKKIGGQGTSANGQIGVDLCTGRYLATEDYVVNPVTSSSLTSGAGFVTSSTTTIEQIVHVRPTITSAIPFWSTAGQNAMFGINGDVGQITFVDAQFDTAGVASGSILNVSGGNCKQVTFRGGYLSGGASAVIVSPSLPSTPTICFQGINADGVFNLVNVNGSCTIQTTGGCRFNNLSQGVFRLNATSTVTLRSDGTNTYVGSSVPFTIGAGTLTGLFYGWDISLDPLGTTGVANTKGQFINSTRSGTANQGPSVATGTSWVALGTGASGVNTVIT